MTTHSQDTVSSYEYPFSFEFVLNNVRHNKPYCFVNRIYPRWFVFMSTISKLNKRKERLYKKVQKGIRKCIERAFVELQSKWHIMEYASRFMPVNAMAVVVKCIAILHSMVVENCTKDNEEDSDNENS